MGAPPEGRAIETVAIEVEGDALGAGLAVSRMEGRAPGESRPHIHAFHQVAVFLTSPGRLEWRFGSGPVEAVRPAPGDLAICPAGAIVQARWERPFESIAVRLTPDRLDRVAEQAGFGPGRRIRPMAVAHDPFLREVTARIAAGTRSDPGQGVLVDALGTALAVHLLGQYPVEADRAAPPLAGQLGAARLARVRAHVAAHLADDLAVDRLAALVGLGRFDFIRQFRAATGTTPHQYVLRCRVEAARALILAGEPIAAAALAVGFASQSHLHGHTRRLLGVTPGMLAREARALNDRRQPPAEPRLPPG